MGLFWLDSSGKAEVYATPVSHVPPTVRAPA